jgi:hypothetical protein
MRQTPTDSHNTLVALLLLSLVIFVPSSSRLWQWKPSSMLDLCEPPFSAAACWIFDEVVGIVLDALIMMSSSFEAANAEADTSLSMFAATVVNLLFGLWLPFKVTTFVSIVPSFVVCCKTIKDLNGTESIDNKLAFLTSYKNEINVY